ncbi:MAG: Grx4 family monothiol glutaredoxin [Myxococcota bacterium]
MSVQLDVRQRIESIVQNSPVVLFMKGERERPECGFSATVVGILDLFLPEYATINVLQDVQLRQGIKEYADWPTIPQLYVRGRFAGGCDILKEMDAAGDLFELLDVPKPAPCTPKVTVTPEAQAALEKVMPAPGGPEMLRLRIDARDKPSLSLEGKLPHDVVVRQDETALVLDPLSASRADGWTIDHKQDGMSGGFAVQPPAAVLSS